MEIPRGFTGETDKILAEAANAAPTPGQAAAPYVALQHGLENTSSELARFAEAAVADQQLQDRVVGQQTAGAMAQTAKSISTDIYEQRQIKQPDGTLRDASDLLDPQHPEQGTFGEKAFRDQMKPIEEATYAKLPSHQRQIAQYMSTSVINQHAAQLQDALIQRRGQDRAFSGVDAVDENIAAGEFDLAKRTNRSNVESGMYTRETFKAVDEHISKESLYGKLIDFSAQSNSGTALTQFVDQVRAIDDPNVTEEMKASVISSMISLHDKSIEQEDKLRTDARHETAISAIRGIISGQIQTDSQLASMNLDSGQITAASSFLHRDGEAIDNRTLVSSIALAISQARSKSPIDQTADSVKLGDDADMALAKGMLSSKTYLDIKTQLTKLNEPIFNDPYYKEAITRAAGFLGADVATMGQGASTEDIMRAVFNNQPKVAAALAEFKFNLDNIAQHTPTGERAGLLSWTLNNIGPYMQTTAGKAASLGSTLRVKYPDVFDLDGHPKTGITRNGIEDKILTDKTLSKPEQDALLNQLPDYLSYLSRLQNLNQAQQQNKGVDVGG